MPMPELSESSRIDGKQPSMQIQTPPYSIPRTAAANGSIAIATGQATKTAATSPATNATAAASIIEIGSRGELIVPLDTARIDRAANGVETSARKTAMAIGPGLHVSRSHAIDREPSITLHRSDDPSRH